MFLLLKVQKVLLIYWHTNNTNEFFIFCAAFKRKQTRLILLHREVGELVAGAMHELEGIIITAYSIQVVKNINHVFHV